MTSSTDAQSYMRAIAGSVTFLAFVTGIGFIAYGRDLLIPIALAILVTLLLNAMTARLHGIPLGSWRLPRWLCMAVSLLLIVCIFALVVDMVTTTIRQMGARAPAYQGNVERMMATVKQSLDLTAIPTLSELLDKIDLRRVVSALVGAISGLASSTGIIAVYVLFLLMEQQVLDAKLAVFSADEEGRRQVRALFEKMARQTRAYIFLKTVNGALCAAIAYVVMVAVGLDFAVFWAFLTFLTYYIPAVGSLIAIALPTLLALVQFETAAEALIILLVSGGLQTAVANILEPRYMGRSMNLSPFVIIVTLFAWGSLWGVAGMFLCVPLTVIAMIVLSHFPRTWRIAVLLSSDGKIDRPPGLGPPSTGPVSAPGSTPHGMNE